MRVAKFMYIYIITNLVIKKQYIGSHVCYKDDPYNDGYWGSSKYLNKDYKIYGKENFKKEIIKFCYDKKTFLDEESKYILEYNTLNPNGYNRHLPNKRKGFYTLGLKFSNESIKKLKGPKSELHKQRLKEKHADFSGKNNPMAGKSVYNIWVEKYGKEEANKKQKIKSEKISKQISIKFKGRKLSVEHKNNLKGPKSELHKLHLKENHASRIAKNNGMFGKYCINNGIINKMIKKEENEQWLNNGWKKGMLKNKKNII